MKNSKKEKKLEELEFNDRINVNEEFSILLSPKYLVYMTVLIHSLSLLLKALTGLYGYSGEKDPPKYGDYEAQRHWMELTVNLPPQDWYSDSNLNPKEYWPLDYPPLSGYYSYIWGYFFKFLLPKSVELKGSWGFESPTHKFLMRFSVLISDLVFYHIPVYLLCSKLFLSKQVTFQAVKKFYITTFLFLCSPVLIIIDHGHFQYNCVMHGLFILSLYFLYNNFFVPAIFTFSLCINFKQMGIYFALPLPFYVLKALFEEAKKKNNKNFTFYLLMLNTFKYALYTVLSFALIWGPWVMHDKVEDVVKRIFPIWRGIFEDKVASFWCTLNMIYKINKIPQVNLIFLSFTFTVLPSFIASVSILWYKKLSKKLTNLCFFIVSMSFFFFSFHVHEKTILVPFLAYVLNYHHLPHILPSFSLISLFSLYPLLKREEQHIPYFVFLTFNFIWNKNINRQKLSETKNQKTKTSKGTVFNILDAMNIVFIIFYHMADVVIPPPKSFPWFYPAINAAYSFANFSLIYLTALKKLFELRKNIMTKEISKNNVAKKTN